MAISALLTAGFLEPISSSNASTPSQNGQRLLQATPQSSGSTNSSAALLAFDTYTPGQTGSNSNSTSGVAYSALFSYGSTAQSQQQASVGASGSVGVGYATTVTNSSTAEVPQSVLDALEGENDPAQQSPSDMLGAIGTAVSQVQQDETQSMQGVAQTGGLSSTDIAQLAKDMANLDSVKKAATANISSSLIAQGYSASDAAKYANALTDTSTTIATSLSSSVSSAGNGVYSSATTQIGISVSEDAQGDLTLISTVKKDASAMAHGAASAANGLDSAQTNASANIANWLITQGYQSLDSNADSGTAASASNSSNASASPSVPGYGTMITYESFNAGASVSAYA
jgi:hypothetical protein